MGWATKCALLKDRFQRQSAAVLNNQNWRPFFLHLVRSWLRIKVAQICPWLQLLDWQNHVTSIGTRHNNPDAERMRHQENESMPMGLWACGTIFGSMNIHFPVFWSIHMRSEWVTAFFPKLLWLLLQESHHLFSRLVLPESPFKNRGICHCNTSQCGLQPLNKTRSQASPPSFLPSSGFAPASP